MRFYVVQDNGGSTVGCEIALPAAHALGREQCPSGSYTITRVDCPVHVETIRRLLGNLGGYATGSTTREYTSRVRK